MKIYMRILPFVLLIFIALPTSAAIQVAQKWYWAYIEAKQQVIAYDVSGDVHVLLENVRPSNLYRIDDLTAVVMIERQQEFTAYILTSKNAYPIAKLYNAEFPNGYALNHPDGVQAMSLISPYILIWNQKYTHPLLFNRETQAVQKLNLEVWETMRRSKDGRYLRYFVEDRVDKNNRLVVQWHIAEYDILKATTRVIFKREEKAPDEAEFIDESCEPDTYGEKWFCNQSIGIYPPKGGMPLSKSQIIHLDGHAEDIKSNQHLKVNSNGDWFLLSTDFYNNYCDETCAFDVTNYATDETQHFNVAQMTLPKGVNFALPYSEVLDLNHLLLIDSHSQGGPFNYLLQDRTKLTYLGVTPCCDFTHMSEDGRWRILYDIRKPKQPSTILVDMKSGRIDLREDGLIDWLAFTEGGISLGGQEFYSYEADRLFKVKEGLYPGGVVDVLPSGVVIGDYPRDIVDENMAGIYTTSNETGRKILVKDAEPIFYPFDLSLQ